VPLDSIQEDFELDHYLQIPTSFKELWKKELAYEPDSTSYLWHLIEQVQREWREAQIQNPNRFGPNEPPQSQAKFELLNRFWHAIMNVQGERFARQLLEVSQRPYVMLWGERFEYNPKNIVRFIYVELVREKPERIVTYPLLKEAVSQWHSEHTLFPNEQPVRLPRRFVRMLRDIGLSSLPGLPKAGRPPHKA
jgi:hypothetical protein